MAVLAPDIGIAEFITGEKFEAICDVDAEKDPHFESSIKKRKEDIVTFFTQTHELPNRMPVIRNLKKKFIIVSHNSDGQVQTDSPRRSIDYQWRDEANVLHWFCQNSEVDNPKVTPIPIALENTYVFGPQVKQQYMINIRNARIKKEVRMFICYNPGTNLSEREPPLKIFASAPWVTIQNGFNNIDLVRPFFDQMARHQFVLCPDGNGIDTIRLWEALYLGCVPIVKSHVFTEYFARYLPIIIVNDWKDITLRFLIGKLQEMGDRQYTWDMLKTSYWKEKINGFRSGD